MQSSFMKQACGRSRCESYPLDLQFPIYDLLSDPIPLKTVKTDDFDYPLHRDITF